MRYSANNLLWRFVDAVTPDVWKSKQAKRIYDAAIEAESDGRWSRHAVGGSVRAVSNRDNLPEIWEPQFGSDKSDEFISAHLSQHIKALRDHADKLEKVAAAYGPSAFRKRTAQLRAPTHPFDAEAEILRVINSGYDEIVVHGTRFIRDASGAFVRT